MIRLREDQPQPSDGHCVAVSLVLVVPMVSGSCCNMLEDSSRSSKASQPEMSASSVSMRFLARSKYRSWRSFPKDWKPEREKGARIRRRDKESGRRDGGSVLSHPRYGLQRVVIQPQFLQVVDLLQHLRLINGRKNNGTIECQGNTRVIQEQRPRVFSFNNNKQSHRQCGGGVGGA